MLINKRTLAQGETPQPGIRRRVFWVLACACLIALTPLAGNAQNAKATANAQRGERAALPAPANTVPGGIAQADQVDPKTGPQNGQQKLDTPGADRRKQIADESNELVALATALKTEVDKTNQDMLSVGVIRKAAEIEKLAHNVKDKLKQNSGGI